MACGSSLTTTSTAVATACSFLDLLGRQLRLVVERFPEMLTTVPGKAP
ncbi:hypothetical protein [Kibdelosporangium philippinense]